MVSDESRECFRKLHEGTPFGASGFDLEGLRQGMGTRRVPTEGSVRCLRTQIGDMPCEWVLAQGADPEVRLLYLHGGGFVSGSGAFYLPLAAHISAAAQCEVLLPDYRLAPEHHFPAGLEDCIHAHEWLATSGPDGPSPAKATFIAGDSAGGGLMLSSLLALRDRKRILPKGGIALSPFADLTLTGVSLTSEADFDPIMSPRCLPDFVSFYLGETDAGDPLASPILGDYTGLPPLLVQVGEHEIIREDSARVAAKARADGVKVTLEVWPGMFHVFQSHDPQLPEGREAVKHIADFMKSCLT